MVFLVGGEGRFVFLFFWFFGFQIAFVELGGSLVFSWRFLSRGSRVREH